MKRWFILFILLTILAMPIMSQEDEVPVPNVTGMKIPQAAAILNILGLNLGNEIAVEPEPGQETNIIVAQSLASGTTAPRGTRVDVSVILSPNMRLIYDDNDITIQNLTDGDMNLGGVVFHSSGDGATSFNPAQVAGVIDSDDCIQIWSIARNEPKDVAGCDSYLWRSTRDTTVHFWTQVNNVQNFSVLDNGVERTVCPAAPRNSQDNPTVCEVYISGGGSASDGDVAPFIYLAYNSSAIAFINTTQDQWMMTNQTTLLNYNPNLSTLGVTLIFGDTNLLREEYRIGVGEVTRLAPQQCIMFTSIGTTVNEPPQNCMVIAQRPLDETVAFWLADFIVHSNTTETELTCPAARNEEVIICIGPR